VLKNQKVGLSDQSYSCFYILDWDDEEDGDWAAPSIANPKCEENSGCGKWEKPMIKNPAYKGKWTAPLIDNPDYKGVWAPRKIPNPNYFEDKSPSDFNKIGAIGFELWSMQNGFLFDNIYIGHSEKDAAALVEESWAIKNKLEKALEPKESEPTGETIVEKAKGVAEKAQAFASDVQISIKEFITLANQDFVDAIKKLPHIAGLLVIAAIIPLLFITSLFSSSPKKKSPVSPSKKKDTADQKESEKKSEAAATGVESSKVTKRAAKTTD